MWTENISEKTSWQHLKKHFPSLHNRKEKAQVIHWKYCSITVFEKIIVKAAIDEFRDIKKTRSFFSQEYFLKPTNVMKYSWKYIFWKYYLSNKSSLNLNLVEASIEYIFFQLDMKINRCQFSLSTPSRKGESCFLSETCFIVSRYWI